MAKDAGRELSTSEFIDALERGQRIYKAFEHALDIARRVANLEGAERDLLKRADEAKAMCDSVERDCAKRKESAQSAAQLAAQSAEKIIADAKAQAEKIVTSALESASATTSAAQEAVHRQDAILQQKYAAVDELRLKIEVAHAELRKIETQLSDARAAKRALLEA